MVNGEVPCTLSLYHRYAAILSKLTMFLMSREVKMSELNCDTPFITGKVFDIIISYKVQH